MCWPPCSFAPGSVGDIQPGNADRAGCRVICIDCSIDGGRFDHWRPLPLRPLLRSRRSRSRQSTSGTPSNSATSSPQRSCLVRSIGSTSQRFGVGESLRVHVSDQSPCRARMRADAAGEADRPSAGVNRRSYTDLGLTAPWNPVGRYGKAGQITDLFHRMRLVRKFSR